MNKKIVLTALFLLLSGPCFSQDLVAPREVGDTVLYGIDFDSLSDEEKASLSGAGPEKTPFWADRTEIRLGEHYLLYMPPKETNPLFPGPIEIIYFYYPGSDWTARSDKIIREWAGKLPVSVKFKPTPAFIFDDWWFLVRISLAFKHLGIENRAVPALIDKLHREGSKFNPVNTIELRSFLSSQGIEVKEFEKAVNSHEVRSKLIGVEKATKMYNIKTVPSIVVDGRFLVQAREDRAPAEILATSTTLVEIAQEARNLGGYERLNK